MSRFIVLTHPDVYGRLLLARLLAEPLDGLEAIVFSGSRTHSESSWDLARKVTRKSGLGMFLAFAGELLTLRAGFTLKRALRKPLRDLEPISALARLARHGKTVMTVTDVNGPSLRRFCAEREIAFALMSRFNQRIGPELLELLPRGVINFHAAPLPEYGGVGSAFQMMAAGSPFTGYTWHRIAEQLDRGEIVHHERYPMPSCSSFVELNLYNHLRGIAALPSVLEAVRSGAPTSPMDLTLRRYYSWPDRGRVEAYRRAFRLGPDLRFWRRFLGAREVDDLG